ncbi:MAG: hypothetical protein ACSHYA_02120 [Opitutaceae bacterium]
MAKASSRSKHSWLIFSICLVHALAWLSIYGKSTLGKFPSPSEALILETAINSAKVETHSLYQGLISLVNRFANGESELISMARGINLAALLLAVLACARAADDFWKSKRTAWITAFLIGMNPVILFRVGQITPTILAILCAAVFAWKFMSWLRRPKPVDSLIIGAALSVGALFDTSLLGLAILWPVAAFLYPTQSKGLQFILGTLPLAAAIALVSVSSLQLPQEFTINGSSLLGHMYGFFSNQEVNDGINYAILSELYALLRFNPIHWGLLLVLAFIGMYGRLKDGGRGYSVYAAILILFIVSIAYGLSDGGGQNRLVASPLLAIFAAGSLSIMPRIWKHAGTLTRRKIVLVVAGTAALTYSGFWINGQTDANREASFTHMAKAAIELDKDNMATKWAEKALALNNERLDIRNVLVRANFNSWSNTSEPSSITIEMAQDQLEAIDQADVSDPTIASIKAFYLWKLKKRDAAVDLWKKTATSSALSQIGILWTQDQETVETINTSLKRSPYQEFLTMAKSINRKSLSYTPEEKIIDNLFAEAY